MVKYFWSHPELNECVTLKYGTNLVCPYFVLHLYSKTAQEMTISSVLQPRLWVALDYLLIANKDTGWAVLDMSKLPFSSCEPSSRTLLKERPSSSWRIDGLFSLSLLWNPFASCRLPTFFAVYWFAVHSSWAANSSYWESRCSSVVWLKRASYLVRRAHAGSMQASQIGNPKVKN